ncbi:MAG: tetratricopeptide repeat protein [Leptospirillia bacterium]
MKTVLIVIGLLVVLAAGAATIWWALKDGLTVDQMPKRPTKKNGKKSTGKKAAKSGQWPTRGAIAKVAGRSPSPPPAEAASPARSAPTKAPEQPAPITYTPPRDSPREITPVHQHLSKEFSIDPELVRALWDNLDARHLRDHEREARIPAMVKAWRALIATFEDASAPLKKLAEIKGEALGKFLKMEFGDVERLLISASRAFADGTADPEAATKESMLSAAAARSMAGSLNRTLDRHAEAAAHYKEAAGLTPLDQKIQKADYLNMCGISSYEAGNYTASEESLNEALELRKDAQGPDHPDVGAASCNLGELYLLLGRPKPAEKMLRRSLEIAEKNFGPNTPQMGKALTHMATLYSEMGKLYRAEPCLHQLIEIIEQHNGTDSEKLYAPLGQLAQLYIDNDRGDEAEPLLKRALSVMEVTYGPNSMGSAKAHIELGKAFEIAEQAVKAEVHYSQALEIQTQTVGSTHFSLAPVLVRLSASLMAQKRDVEARAHLQHALDVGDIDNAERPEIAEALALMAELYRKDHLYADAGPLFLRAVKMLEHTIGPEAPLLAITLEHYAKLFRDMGDQAEAEVLEARARKIRGEEFEEEEITTS